MQQRSIDIQQSIDNGGISAYQWLIFIAGTLIILADGLDTGAIGYIAPSLMDEWNVTKPDLAPILSAALFGMSIGALGSGPLADRIGRKWIVILTTGFFGTFTLASAYATSTGEMTLLRFLTGLGLGAAMPNIATLVSEYMPRRVRAKMVNTMLCAFPLGIAIGGVLSARMIPTLGWHSILVVGGAFALALVILLIVILPESLQYLINRGQQAAARRIVGKMYPDLQTDQVQFVLPWSETSHTGSALSLILSRSYLLSSVMLWLTCFMSLLVFYLLTSWLPVILREAGFNTEQYSLLTAVFPFGGVIGTLMIGWAMDRFNPNRALAYAYVISAALLIVTGLLINPLVMFGLLIFLSGMGLVGAQSSMPSLTAIFYPVQGRATGVAWMHGIGRIGAIVGAYFGSVILGLGLTLTQIFFVLAVPLVCAAVALFVKCAIAPPDAAD